MDKPALLLLPNLLGEHKQHQPYLPSSVDKAVSTLDGLIAESLSAGRRYLGRFATKKPQNQIPIALFNLHTPDEEIDFLLEPILKGERWGLVSDAGLPCVADPGSKIVRRARQRGIAVQAFVGPHLLAAGAHALRYASPALLLCRLFSKRTYKKRKRNQGTRKAIQARSIHPNFY